MADLSTFEEYNKLADLLIEKVSKEAVVRGIRLTTYGIVLLITIATKKPATISQSY